MVVSARDMQVVRLFSTFTVLSTGIGLISVSRSSAENKADNTINCPPLEAGFETAIVLVVCYRTNYYNGMVVSARNMQVVRLFSSFTVLLSGIGLMSVARIAVENKGDNTIGTPKTRREKSNFSSYVSDQISIIALIVREL